MVREADNTASLRQSIQQGQPFPSPQVEGFLTVLRTSDRLAEKASEPLRIQGLTVLQYNVMRILRGSEDGLRVHEVAERMVSRAPNITRLVDRLEDRGWLSRVRCTEDRRAVHLHLTREGIEVLDQLESPVIEAVHDATRGLDGPQMQNLCDLLNQLRQPLETESRESRRHQSRENSLR